MEENDLRSTALHEAAHATVSHLIGEAFLFVEVADAKSGVMQPCHSPCPVCGGDVLETRACQACLEHYEKNDPATDERSQEVCRAYRVEAAVAAAGEIAEREFNGGALFAEDAEVAWDRDRVATRASLRHFWQEDACSGYCGDQRDCAACRASAEQLRTNVRSLVLDPQIWSGITALADQLVKIRRMSGDEVVVFLETSGVGFGSASIEVLWPALHSTASGDAD